MMELENKSNEQQTPEYELAPRLSRLVAKLIDITCVMMLVVIIADFTGIVNGFDPDTPPDYATQLKLWVVMFCAWLAINAYPLHKNAQTVGKRIVGIKIVRLEHSRADLTHIVFFRALPIQVVSLIPFIGAIISLVDIMMIYEERRRCLHDYIADTIVVIEKK